MIDKNKYYYFTIFTTTILIGYIPFNIMVEYFNISYGPRLTDFDTYYYSAHRFITGDSIYAEVFAPDGSSRKFMYPPIAIMIFLPFAYLPFTIAGVLWNLFSLAILSIGIIKLIDELMYERGSEATKYIYTVVVLCVIGFSPTINWVKAGQASGVVASGLCFSMAYLFESKRNSSNLSLILSSALIPAVSLIKPYYAPSGAHLLQDIRRFGYSVLTAALLIVLSMPFLGYKIYLEYINQLLEGGSSLIFTTPPSNWNASVYSPLYILGELATEIRIIIVLATIISVILLTQYEYDRLNVALLGLVIIPIATPTRVDGLVALIPVYLVLLARYWNNKLFRFLALLSLILVHIHPYTIELLSKLGPRHISAFESLVPIIPILQPALWGHILLICLLVYVIITCGLQEP